MAASNAELELRIERNTNDIVAIYHMIDENKQLLTTGLARVDGRLDGIDGRLDGIDGRLDGIDGRIEGLDQRLDRMQSTLDRIDARG